MGKELGGGASRGESLKNLKAFGHLIKMSWDG
jgi:hypothetical protein